MCIRDSITNDPKAWGGFLLFDDSQYSNSQYNKAHPLSFQSSLLKAANMLLEKFKIEDEIKDKKVISGDPSMKRQ